MGTPLAVPLDHFLIVWLMSYVQPNMRISNDFTHYRAKIGALRMERIHTLPSFDWMEALTAHLAGHERRTSPGTFGVVWHSQHTIIPLSMFAKQRRWPLPAQG
jgi:hypothetical protein